MNQLISIRFSSVMVKSQNDDHRGPKIRTQDKIDKRISGKFIIFFLYNNVLYRMFGVRFINTRVHVIQIIYLIILISVLK